MGRSTIPSSSNREKASKKRMNWEGEAGKVVIALYVKNYERYVESKAKTVRRWTERLCKDERFKESSITHLQVKNFISSQEKAFRQAIDKRDSTGFGDLDGESAQEQLLKICKYWYISSMSSNINV